MKKRKELDALLTMANGKKNGKSKRSKEGHELLRLDSDSNSSDNDELFLAPKKTVIRRPRQCQCCAMCVPLVMFILTMGCMVITGGLIWMHFNLKQDLDDLRLQLQKVEKQANSASSQQNTILDIDERLQRLNDIPEKVDITALKIKKVNESIYTSNKDHEDLIAQLRGEVEALESRISTTSATNLGQTVADLGSDVESLKKQYADQENKITSNGETLNQLTTDINTLKSQVAELQHPPTLHPATPSPAVPTTRSATPERVDGGSTTSSIDAAQLTLLREEMQRLSRALDEVNVTVETLSSEHRELASTVVVIQHTLAQVTELPTTTASHNSTSPQSLQAGQFDLAQMKADIELLKVECNRSIASIPTLVTPIQSPASVNNSQMQVLTERIQTIEERIDANVINVTVTDSMQYLLERGLKKFKEENLADVTELRDSVNNIQNEMEKARTFEEEVGVRMVGMEDQISILKKECEACQASAAAPTQTSAIASSPIKNPPDSTSASSLESTSEGSIDQGNKNGTVTEPPSSP